MCVCVCVCVCTHTHSDGRLIYIDGNDESGLSDDDSMVEVNGHYMADGTLLKLTQMKTSSLTTEKYLTYILNHQALQMVHSN